MPRLSPRLRPGLVLTLLALTGLAMGVARIARGAVADTPQKKTISDLRNVGTAMFSWYKDVQAPKQAEAAHATAQKTEKTEKNAKSAHHHGIDLAQIPEISHDELAKLLVPKYIQAVPEKDGWGNAYEFRLNTSDPNARRIMAVRSSGADGKFSGIVYRVGAFPKEHDGEDLVWVDGYFTRWPTD